ncbi:MAG: AI-2E family transporter YdiK [Dongiaceae bacterium]
MQPQTVRHDLAQRTLGVLVIAGLIGTSLWILEPFLPAIVWATTLVIATWPIMQWLQDKLWGSRALAAAIMTVSLLLVFVVPFWLAIGTIARHSDQVLSWAEVLTTMHIPPPPAWLESIPLIGDRLTELWTRVAESEAPEILQRIRPYAGKLTDWFIGAVGSFGIVLVQFLLTVAMSAILYANGERAVAYVRRFGNRLAGPRGEQAVILAGKAIRGVALGVVVTAFIQSAIGSAALFIAGVPYASILSALVFMLCIAQLGPGLVLIPTIIWMYANGTTGAASLLLVLSVIAIGIDNILRPVLIRRGVDLPLLLILSGVIGGLMAFGLIGIFLGPTLLAVTYTLLDAWIAEGDEAHIGSDSK